MIVIPMERKHRKRLVYLDSARGFFTVIIIFAHSLSHLMFWDMELIPLEDVNIFAIIVLSPVIILATCAPVFVQISAVALSYNFFLDINDYITAKNEETGDPKERPQISFKDPRLLRIVKKNLINYTVLLGASIAHVFLFHYGLNWNNQIQRTLLTGILETGGLSIDFEVYFQTDAIGLIAFSGLFNVGLLILLLRKNGYYKPVRNLCILLALIFTWYVLSPLIHSALDDVFWASLNNGQYGLTFLLKFIVGPPMSIFPNFAYGFAGIIIGMGFAQEKKRIFFRKLAIYLSIIFIGAAGILILIKGFTLSPEAFGLFLPIELQALDFAVVQIMLLLFIEVVAYSKKNKQHIHKKTRLWQRFGRITMTIYIFESVLCILNMKWYVPLWKLLPQTSLILHLELFVFVGMQLALWYGIILLWEKKNFKYSVEWFMVVIRRKFMERSSAPPGKKRAQTKTDQVRK